MGRDEDAVVRQVSKDVFHDYSLPRRVEQISYAHETAVKGLILQSLTY